MAGRKPKAMPVTPGPKPVLAELPPLPDDARDRWHVLDEFTRTKLDVATLDAAWSSYVAGRPAEEAKRLLDTEGAALLDEWKALRERIKALKGEAAEKVQISTLPEPTTEFERVSAQSYGSQGLGALNYATGSAHTTAETLQRYGFTARVEVQRQEHKISTSPGARPYVSEAAVVFVNVAPEDVQILRCRDLSIPMDEWVASCWRRGVNPRVYNPFLPHGFEAAHGIDYQGRRTKVTT